MKTLDPSPTFQPSSEANGMLPSDATLVQVFNEMSHELISTLMYLLGSRDDAQDVAQETFLKCWRTRENLGTVTNLRAWIFRVGLNTAKDLQRSAWNRKSKSFMGDDAMFMSPQESPLVTIEKREDLDRLRQAIMELRPEEKEVFLLRQNGGFTYEQIAEIRKSPVGTVKTQMRAALRKLRIVLN